ncbi:MAG: hypothetical protein M1836_003710 [Candelina mexicana]|nr:MAG: hypothetical protein M1836_003710 [Candelina mexicana]
MSLSKPFSSPSLPHSSHHLSNNSATSTNSFPPSPIPPSNDQDTNPTNTSEHNLDNTNANNDASFSQPPPPPRPPFTPFFTLLEDHTTHTTHHPTTHYLFSDDSTDLLTAACLRSLSEPTLTSSSSLQNRAHLDSSTTTAEDAASDDNSGSGDGLPPARPGIQDRYLILDMSSTGKDVVSAHSLSSEWAILDTEVSKAPTFASSPSRTNSQGQENEDNGLMLRIEGTEIVVNDDGGAGEGDMEALLSVFEKRMGDLRKVVEGGGKKGMGGGGDDRGEGDGEG